ncbi:tryptophan 7-halogenase [Pseudoalteromonas sp. DL2-H2.2]|uniref:tryptophan halogenase family protein n=1 Tax=Pseudoalteromonas sp. DL2-H2.2 TaxID=2908889 RepID=UPI001F29D0E2|nr:tryptophan halogenase family protein [Pseudoalteromonas sp. DL2-H2.2]MCF2908186.1 tryptophan 7-halogenase [Pseudoalteromonas sp. DL2-H2.2]
MIEKIVIVGGGTAGWLAANHLVKRFDGSCVEVSLMESENIPTIGVGEGTVPMMRQTLEYFGIDEGKFIQRCNVAFKQGIRFEGWMKAKGGQGHAYYHPFDYFAAEDTLIKHWLAEQTHPLADLVGIQSALCEHNRAPKLITQPQYQGAASYAYHLDAGAFSELLKQHATETCGVHYFNADLQEVKLDADGAIQSLVTSVGEVTADLYIDCTGFASLLLGSAMAEPFVDKSDILFADKALAVQVPYQDDTTPIASFTRSSAQTAGWIWDIGLYTRRGVGHVYSSNHTSAQQAYTDLERYVGRDLDSLEVRSIDMRVGYHRRAWKHNCVALGLSQGFVEPLEATGLLVFDVTAKMLADTLPSAPQGFSTAAEKFNQVVQNMWDKVIDFIKLHYCISDRDDSAFWQDNRQLTSIPPTLQAQLERWRYNVPDQYDFSGKFDVFNLDNYLYVLYGMSYPTCTDNNRLSSAQQKQVTGRVAQITRQRSRAIELAPQHRDLLTQIRQYGLGKI